MNNKEHSCEEYDGECQGWKGYHGNDHDWTTADFRNASNVDDNAEDHRKWILDKHPLGW